MAVFIDMGIYGFGHWHEKNNPTLSTRKTNNENLLLKIFYYFWDSKLTCLIYEFFRLTLLI